MIEQQNAESVTVSATDLRRVLQYMEERVQLRSFAGQEMLNILDRLGDAVLKARMAEHNDCGEIVD